MNILIAGATGFIGKRLVKALLEEGHKIMVVGRSIDAIRIEFKQTTDAIEWSQLETFQQPIDVIINLAGFNIAKRRWRSKVKNTLIDSRVNTTTALCNWIKQHSPNTKLFNASAVSIHDDADGLFLHEIAKAWEQAVDPDVNSVITRFAVVLDKKEGALKQMLIPYKMKSGNVLGTGEQPFAWIHIDDVVRGTLFLLHDKNSQGAYDFVAPEIVTQKELNLALCKAMKCFFSVRLPAFIIKGMMGQMGDELLLHGQRAKPTRLLEAGFKFKYPDIEALCKYLKDS